MAASKYPDRTDTADWLSIVEHRSSKWCHAKGNSFLGRPFVQVLCSLGVQGTRFWRFRENLRWRPKGKVGVWENWMDHDGPCINQTASCLKYDQFQWHFWWIIQRQNPQVAGLGIWGFPKTEENHVQGFKYGFLDILSVFITIVMLTNLVSPNIDIFEREIAEVAPKKEQLLDAVEWWWRCDDKLYCYFMMVSNGFHEF